MIKIILDFFLSILTGSAVFLLIIACVATVIFVSSHPSLFVPLYGIILVVSILVILWTIGSVVRAFNQNENM